MERRSLLKALVGLVAAPAIIKVAGVMPVNASLQPDKILVSASYQSGASLVVHPLPGRLMAGDVITIEGVNGFSRFGEPTNQLRQFVVTANAEAGHTSFHIYPSIVGEHQAHRTVVEYPLNLAEIKVVAPAIPRDWR